MKSPHLNKEWLYQKYIVEQLSTYDIGKIVNRDPKRIYEKLIDFEIPTRPRGHNLHGLDNHFNQPDYVNPFLGKRHSDKTKAILSKKASISKPNLRGKNNGMFGMTGDKNPHYIDGSSPERQSLYAGSRWKEIVRTIYARDNYRCVRCGSSKLGARGLHAHHIRAWAGNPDERENIANIVTLCRKCHEWVHSKENINRDFLG